MIATKRSIKSGRPCGVLQAAPLLPAQSDDFLGVLASEEERSGMMTSVEKRIVRVAQWGGDIMFKNIALAAILAVAVTGGR